MRRVAASTRQPYTHAVRLRPDFVVLAPMPQLAGLACGPPDAPRVLLPPGGPEVSVVAAGEAPRCHVPNDIFGVGEWPLMERYLERFLYLQSVPQGAWGNATWSAESYLQHFVEAAGGTLTETASLLGCYTRHLLR